MGCGSYPKNATEPPTWGDYLRLETNGIPLPGGLASLYLGGKG